MKKTKLIVFVTIVMISCTTPEFEFPLVFTGDAGSITDSSAVMTGKIINIGRYPIIESGFVWGLYSNDELGIREKNTETKVGSFSLETSERLFPGRTYYVRAYVQTSESITYGNEVSFTSADGKLRVDSGKWTLIYPFEYLGCNRIDQSFVLDETVYFLITSYERQYGLFKYDVASNTLEQIIQDDNLVRSRVFVYENAAYFFFDNVLYLFNPMKKELQEVTRLGTQVINGGTGFLIDSDFYFGLGWTRDNGFNTNFWKYSFRDSLWEQIEPYPGDQEIGAFSFSEEGIGFIGGGYTFRSEYSYDMWAYNPKTDRWVKRSPIPHEIGSSGYLNLAMTEEHVYFKGEKSLYEYNSTFDIWQVRTELPSSCYSFLYSNEERIFLISFGDEYYYSFWISLGLWKYEE